MLENRLRLDPIPASPRPRPQRGIPSNPEVSACQGRWNQVRISHAHPCYAAPLRPTKMLGRQTALTI